MHMQQLFGHDPKHDDPDFGKQPDYKSTIKYKEERKQAIERYKQMIKMIIVVLIPIGNLVAMSTIVQAQNLHLRQQSLMSIEAVRQSTQLGNIFIQMEKEKEAASIYCMNFTRYKQNSSLTNIQEISQVTDDIILSVSKNSDDVTKHFLINISSTLIYIREQDIKACTIGENFTQILYKYSDQMESLIDFSENRSVAPENTVLWKKIISKFSLYRAFSSMGNERICGLSFFLEGSMTPKLWMMYIMNRDETLRMLDNTFNYDQEIEVIFKEKVNKLLNGCKSECLQKMTNFIIDQNISSFEEQNDVLPHYWMGNMSEFMSIMESIIIDLQKNLLYEINSIALTNKKNVIAYILITSIVSIVCISLFIFYVQQINKITAKVYKYANQIGEKSRELAKEKEKSEALLCQMLPPTVVDNLRTGVTGTAETFPSVSVYFSDIQNFSDLTVVISPFEVVDFLNYVYSTFDSIIDKFSVYKVETIGASYMVVCGLPVPNALHVPEIASMALELLRIAGTITMPNGIGTIPLRSGMHTGTCVAGVIGTKMPRYCLFGDTVNTASRMQSTGMTYKIHVSNNVKLALDAVGGFVLEERGKIFVKGKGDMITHWLMNKIEIDPPKQNGSILSIQDVVDS